MKTTKEKGDTGLTAAIYEFTKNGFNVSLPIAEHLKYDMVIEKNNVLARVQCRYTTADNNLMHVKLSSVWSNKKGNHKIKRNQNDYDILSVYCPNTNQCCFLADQEFGAKEALEINLNDEKTSEKTRLSKDYLSCDRAFEIWLTAKNNNSKKLFDHKKQIGDLLSKEKILELKKTMSNHQIGILYGISHVSVANLINKYGIVKDVGEIVSVKQRAIKDEILNLYKNRESKRNIAKKVGCSRYAITRVIDEEVFKNTK